MSQYRRLLEAAPALTREDFERLRGFTPKLDALWFATMLALAEMARA